MKHRRFNPGMFQSDADLKKQFVVRHGELKHVMGVLTDNIDAESCKHLLLTGARGQGKTMLLARARAEVRSKKTLSKHLLPVWFMEESYEIWNLADFWLEAMVHAAAELDEAGARELRATYERLSESDAGEKVVAREACDALLEAAGGRKLVLMVENLDALCEAMASHSRFRRTGIGWLKETVGKRAGQVMLLATSIGRPAGVGPRQTFFDVIDLQPLTTAECEKLLKSLGQERGDARALEILTGGNPRMLGIVASFAHKVDFDALAEDMVSLLDEHTEYFKGYLESFGAGERRIFLALADLWKESTAREVAKRARMDIRTTSALLGRLVTKGVVTQDKGDDSRWRYEVTMRLVSIYYRLRHQRDNNLSAIRLFQFMAVYYHNEAREMHDGIAKTSLLDEVGQELDRVMAAAMNESARRGKTPKEVLTVCEETIARFAADEKDGKPHVRLELVETHVIKGFAHLALGDREAALEAWGSAAETSGVLLTTAESDEDVEKANEQVAWALIGAGEAHRERGEVDDALASYDKVIAQLHDTPAPRLRLQLGRAFLLKGAMRYEQDAHDSARDAFECACRVLDVASDVGERLAWYAVVCLSALHPSVVPKYAEQVYKPVVEQLRRSSPVFTKTADEGPTESVGQGGWYSKWFRAQALLQLGESASALEAFRQAYELYDPKDAKMMDSLFEFVAQVDTTDPKLVARLRDVLESNPEKADQLRPFTFTLHAGENRESFQAHSLMMEIGNDIRKRIVAKQRGFNGASWMGAAQEAAVRIASALRSKATEFSEGRRQT